MKEVEDEAVQADDFVAILAVVMYWRTLRESECVLKHLLTRSYLRAMKSQRTVCLHRSPSSRQTLLQDISPVCMLYNRQQSMYR